MRIRILESDLRLLNLRTRMPFRYGIATMTEVPEAFLFLTVEVDGQRARGISSDCLPPKWFTKVPGKPLDEEVAQMLMVIRHAMSLAEGLSASNVFGIWHELYRAHLAWGKEQGLPALLASFGTSLVERALMDAVCRHLRAPLWQVVSSEPFGIQPGALGLRHARVAEFLPGRPLQKIVVRHTVGLSDSLTDADIPEAERVDDGLPQSLEAAARQYGLRHFKVKLSGDLATDGERLRAIARLFESAMKTEYAVSLDGNEQFRSLKEFREFWSDLAGRRELGALFERLIFVEQPLHRDVALNPRLRGEFEQWRERPPMVIDESDGAMGDLAMALEIGYAGTSHKNCKGVIKGIANFCLLEERRAVGRHGLLMTGEDLCNVGVALLQDLAVMALLGITSVERNGHHYHAGLSQFPKSVQEAMLRNHSDLYHRGERGWPTLTIRNGEVALDSVNTAPFGVAFAVASDDVAVP